MAHLLFFPKRGFVLRGTLPFVRYREPRRKLGFWVAQKYNIWRAFVSSIFVIICFRQVLQRTCLFCADACRLHPAPPRTTSTKQICWCKCLFTNVRAELSQSSKRKICRAFACVRLWQCVSNENLRVAAALDIGSSVSAQVIHKP